MLPLVVRFISREDDLSFLTHVIRSAYAKHLARDLRYWATHQSVAETAQRIASGQGFIAEIDGVIVGTVTLRSPQSETEVEFYRDSTVWTLSQFAVLPAFQSFGIGRQLHDAAMACAQSAGALWLALDTAEPASELLEMYHRWGYTIVGQCDWRPHTNYLSVVMARPIPFPHRCDVPN